MKREEFLAALGQQSTLIERICQSAHELHESVNQTYGSGLPYGYHLDMVADFAERFGHLVCAEADDVVPMLFGAYYHDSIEDARLTYNDVKKVASTFMDDRQALLATEIVYALTNDKGRTRAERAGEKYYAGIRATPYAPFMKLCDRVANISYSCRSMDADNLRVKEVYKGEMPHFLASIRLTEADANYGDERFGVPSELVEVLAETLIDDLEQEERRAIRDEWLR